MSKLLRVKIIFTVLLFIGVTCVAAVLIYEYNPALEANRCTQELQSNLSETGLNAWSHCILSTDLNSQITKPISAYTVLADYSANYSEYNINNLIDLIPLDFTISSTTQQEIPFTSIQKSDAQFLQDKTYTLQPGVNGKDQLANIDLHLNDTTIDMTVWQQRLSSSQQEITFTGASDSADIKKTIKDNLTNLLKAVTDKNQTNIALVSPEAASQMGELTNIAALDYKLTTLSAGVVSYDIQGLSGQVVPVGKLELIQPSCSHGSSLPVVYSPTAHKYYFTNVWSTFGSLCSSEENTGGAPHQEILIDCDDCMYAPVDKIYKLPSDYEPANLTEINLPGGGRLTQTANDALNAMAADAATHGISLAATSAYRSYIDQQAVFEGWVQNEMAQGYDRATAEIRANTYSAWPGHSEHQLGTTLDITCVNCTAFDNYQNNLDTWDYVAQNSYKFGFVVSYPQGMENLTGYEYEPWHIRYIGVDLATELNSTGYLSGSGMYSTLFLRQKHLY